MNPHALAAVFITHWAGDFLFQTSDMAQQKHKSLKWLTIHVGVYTSTLFVGSLVIFDFKNAFLFTFANSVFHWATDFFTSKVINRYSSNLRVFYPLIGFDQ